MGLEEREFVRACLLFSSKCDNSGMHYLEMTSGEAKTHTGKHNNKLG